MRQQVEVRVSDPTVAVVHDLELSFSDETTVGDLLEAIVEALGWPRQAANGSPLRYRLRKATERSYHEAAERVLGLALARGETVIAAIDM